MKTYVISTAVIKYKNKFLIGQRTKSKKFAPNKWEFISGFIDTKNSAEEIILKELKEEANLSGKLIKTSSPYITIDNEGRWIIIPFLIEAKTDKFKINKKDHSNLLWLSKNELFKYKDISNDLKELSKRGFFK